MLHIVVFGKLDQTAEADHVVVGARRLQRGVLGRIEEFEIARTPLEAEAVHILGGGEPVPEQLAHGEVDAGAGDRLSLRGAGGDAGAVAAGIGVQVDARQELASHHGDGVVCCAVGVESGSYFGVALDRLLDRAAQGTGRRCLRLCRHSEGAAGECGSQ